MADPSPDAALQGLPPGKGSLSEGLLRSKRRADNYSRAPRMRHRLWRKQWTPRNHKLHKVRNAQKAARRSPEGAFKRLVNDLAEEMGLDFRFHPKAYAALYEEFESFGVGYFSALKIHANHANRVTVQLEDSELLRWLMRPANPSHPFAKYEPKQSK